MNKVLDKINKDEDSFVQTTMESKAADHLKEVKQAGFTRIMFRARSPMSVLR